METGVDMKMQHIKREKKNKESNKNHKKVSRNDDKIQDTREKDIEIQVLIEGGEYREKEKKKRKEKKKKREQKRSLLNDDKIEDPREKDIEVEEAGAEGGEETKRNKKKRRRERIVNTAVDTKRNGDDGTEVKSTSYAYEVDDDDHCESPQEAYRDIDHLLQHASVLLQRSKATLRIYDPYHCNGAIIERLNNLGYYNVYNKNEDFYASIRDDKIPEYDVLVTNPPYSGDHIEKLLKFVIASHKPSFLLIPNYVYMKDYYSHLISQHKEVPLPVFVVPNKRYLYTTPYGRRQAKSAKYTSPFPTFWFCFTGSQLRQSMIDMARNHVSSTCKFVPYAFQLPLEVCPDNDPRKKKMRNNEKRKKNKNRKKSNAR